MLSSLLTWGAVALVFAALSGLGRLVPSQHATNTHSVSPLWRGWGLGVLLFTVYVALVPTWSLTALLVALAGLALIGHAIRPWSWAQAKLTLWLLLFSAPLFFAWSHNQVFMWDDFAHRLPSLMYVVQFDSLPRPHLPASLSHFPAYPYALTMLGMAVSRVLGAYTELSIAMLNGALLVAFMGIVAQLITPKGTTAGWKIMLLAVLFTTTLNPFFKGELVASAYQEVSLGLAVAVAWLLAMQLVRPEAASSWPRALGLGLVLALVVGLKQVGLVLVVLLVAPLLAWLAWPWRHHLALWARTAALVLLPPVLTWLAWRHYVQLNLSGGEFAFQPLDQWHWSLLPTMLENLGLYAFKKPAIFLPLLAVSTVLLFTWRKAHWASLRLPLGLAALVGWGYLAFLFVAYLGSFSAYEATKLASLSRYLQHVNWLLWLVCLMALNHLGGFAWCLRQRWVPVLGLLLTLIPLVVPKQFAGRSSAEALHMQTLAAQLPQHLPKGAHIRLNEPEGFGFRTHALQYYVGHAYRITQGQTTYGVGSIEPSDAHLTITGAPPQTLLQRCHATSCTQPTLLLLPQ
jgi:hypothetical protein